MANLIKSGDKPPLQMSNSTTSVVLDVLVIAGCDLAATPWEQKLVYWLAQHDQTRSGLGCVGFDIRDLGWIADELEAQKQFVLRMIDAALARRGWERLPFTPGEERVMPALERLRELVGEVAWSASQAVWVPSELPAHGSCEVHRVYLHETGCILCNDAPIDADAATAPHRS